MSESRLNGYHEQLLEALRATAAVGIHNKVGGSIDDRDSGRETHSGRPSPKLAGERVGGERVGGERVTGEGGRKGSGERAGGGSREERESAGGGGRSGHEKSSFSALGVGADPLSDYSGKKSPQLDHILASCYTRICSLFFLSFLSISFVDVLSYQLVKEGEIVLL